jgi:hypothetical protein
MVIETGSGIDWWRKCRGELRARRSELYTAALAAFAAAKDRQAAASDSANLFPMDLVIATTPDENGGESGVSAGTLIQDVPLVD